MTSAQRRGVAGATAGLAVAVTVLLGARRFVPPTYEREEAAVAFGRERDIGSARLEGPAEVEVLTHQTWTFVYTAGRAGIRPGGAIRIAMRHIHQWSPPQTTRPGEEGFISVQTTGASHATVQVADRKEAPVSQYFPWQHIVQVNVSESDLRQGEQLRVTYGDRRDGGPGMRVQPFDETHFVFKCFVDALGNGDFVPLAEHPAVRVVAGEPYRLSVIVPSDAVVGEPTWCLVRAEDRYGNPADRFRGTVQWKCTDPDARLPAEYAFTGDDFGVHRFNDVVWKSVGRHAIRVASDSFSAIGNPLRVAATRPQRLLLWGDIHGHTLYSDGRGTVEEYYAFADEVAGLDFCAVTDHAFEILDDMWAHSKQVTNRFYKPGRFVTFQAFEWSGATNVGGDHNVYFLEDDPPIYRSELMYDRRNFQMDHDPASKVAHVTEVFERLAERLRDKDVFCIPHFGGRKGNPKWHNPEVQRMIEIFSEHRRSEDWATTFLTKGYRVGIMASTDDHYGNPGHGYLKPSYLWDSQEIGMAAVAVYAPERTREALFRALYDRHVYATSGERIILEVHADHHPMGSEYKTIVVPTLEVDVVGTAPIAKIEIKKNSQVVYSVEPDQPSCRLTWRDPNFDAGATCYYYVRVLQTDNEEAISSPIWIN